MVNASPRDKTAIQVIERMMKLLDALASRSDPVSLKDLAGTTGLHPSTAHRILNDMVVGRFVDRAETPGLPPGNAFQPESRKRDCQRARRLWSRCVNCTDDR
jgi:hypothetical protein